MQKRHNICPFKNLFPKVGNILLFRNLIQTDLDEKFENAGLKNIFFCKYHWSGKLFYLLTPKIKILFYKPTFYWLILNPNY